MGIPVGSGNSATPAINGSVPGGHGVPAGASIQVAEGIVSLTDVKTHLNMTGDDGSHDAELQGFINAATPLVEHVVGPVVGATYTEAYDGGTFMLSLRHYPVLAVTSVTEYSWATGQALTQIAQAKDAAGYSFTFDAALNQIRRWTTGGVQWPFFWGTRNIVVAYTAGRAVIPPNVRLAALELIRENYQQTQQGGRRGLRAAAADDQPTVYPDVFMSPRVRSLLAPHKRPPFVA